MNLWGYAFWDHIPTLYARALTAANISHTESVRRATIIASKYRSKAPDKEPDFAFEMANGNVALMESKGRFVNYGDANPPAKGDLNEALDQLKDWPRLIQPTPQKSFGMGTYLREMRDKTDPSLILFVDPPPRRQRDDIEPLEFPKDWIRRGNYGNWLVGMGLEDAGIALREGREKQIEEVSLPVLELGGRSFVFTWEGWAISSRRAFSLEDFFHWHGPMLGRSWAVISGIEIGVMKLIERSVRNAADPALMEVEPLMEFTVPDQYYASVLPDGTLWGAIRLDDFWHPRSETFKL
jgi:hypothetical protein